MGGGFPLFTFNMLPFGSWAEGRGLREVLAFGVKLRDERIDFHSI